MLARQTFRTEPAEQGTENLLVCLHPESATLMLWIGTDLNKPGCVLRGEELSRFIRWLSDPEFKG